MQFEFAFELKMRLGERVHIPITADQVRGAVLVERGTFCGPGFNGIVVSGSGGDFPLVRRDGGAHFDATYLLRTDDGVTILKRNAGVRHAEPEVIQRLMQGEAVDPAAYYMRLTPRFEAPAGRYDWLNRTIFIGTGQRGPEGSVFRYWKVV
jgi:hypothetical protein